MRLEASSKPPIRWLEPFVEPDQHITMTILNRTIVRDLSANTAIERVRRLILHSGKTHPLPPPNFPGSSSFYLDIDLIVVLS
jgi:hypothetical protein